MIIVQAFSDQDVVGYEAFFHEIFEKVLRPTVNQTLTLLQLVTSTTIV